VQKIIFCPYGSNEIGLYITDCLAKLSEKGINVDFPMIAFTAKKLEVLTKGDMRKIMEFVKELIAAVFASWE
jgi:hypothetical protein